MFFSTLELNNAKLPKVNFRTVKTKKAITNNFEICLNFVYQVTAKKKKTPVINKN